MKKLVLIVIIGVAIVGWFAKNYFSSPANAVTLPETWVQASKISEHAMPLEINVIGSISARSVEITPEVPGHVREILFTNGSFVHKDTPLLKLDDEVYKTKYTLAKAKLFYSKTDYKRMVLLGKRGVIAQQAIDQAAADYKEKLANALEAKVFLEKMKLVAPFDGIVGKRKVNKGDFVTVGQSIVTLTDTKHLHVDYNVPEKFLAQLKLGQTIKITATAYPGRVFEGIVAYIAPTISIENRAITLYAEVKNEDGTLRPGMFVNVIQALGTDNKVVMIPVRSLMPIMDGQQVYKIQDGKAYPTKITIGKRIQDQVQVLEGLTVGDVIITDGQLKVKPGMPVKFNS